MKIYLAHTGNYASLTDGYVCAARDTKHFSALYPFSYAKGLSIFSEKEQKKTNENLRSLGECAPRR